MRDEFYAIFVFVLIMWLVYIVDAVIPASLIDWGLQPRSFRGLVGIPLSPFLHSGIGHLFSNTIPLVILLALLAGSRASSWVIVVGIVFVGGGLLWVVGRNYNHVGASGLVFGLISFLIVSGLMERRLVSLAIALLVGFLYGGTLIGGVLPRFGSEVSWDGHLCGAIAGAVAAYVMVGLQRAGDPKRMFDR